MALTTDDIVAIHQLYATYNHTIDFGTPEEWADTFTNEGSLDAGSPVAGREGLLAFHVATRKGVPGIRHLVTNVVVDGADDTATGSAYLQATVGAGADRTNLITGRYADELVRTADGWRFTKRILHPDG